MNHPIMIMGAMEDVELNVLKEKMEIKNGYHENKYVFYEGILDSKEVVLACTHIGFINASVATTLAIQKYHPSMIISQGIAGGHGDIVHKKDVIIATEVMNINSYFTPKKEKGEGINILEYQLVDFDKEQWNEVPYVKSTEALLEKAKLIEYPYGKVHIGRIGSGDVWNNEADRINWFSNTHGTLCEEMEGYAIGKIATNYQIPFIAFRAISNNEMINEEYNREIGKLVQEFVLKFICIC